MWRLIVMFAVSIGASVAASPVAFTSLGSVRGKVGVLDEQKSCHEFFGIPYAEPPIGTRRFAPPTTWTTPFPKEGLNATSYGRWCPQLDSNDYGDEDCLKLNVWRPSSRANELAVMVWIYGGAFVFGDDGDTQSANTYDGCGLAAWHDVIVVGMNYRVGPFSFVAFPGSAGIESNFGMQDQREALRWVQREIRNFGGNPNKVTIFGESAGAISVWYHIASPRSKGLFHGAISQSGIATAVTGAYAIRRTQVFAAQLGCLNVTSMRDCLMKKSVKDIIDKSDEASNPFTNAGWNPCVDGLDMPGPPGKMLNESQSSSVPLLVGFNTDEATAFVYPYYEFGMSDTQFYDFVNAAVNKHPELDPANAVNKSVLKQILSKYSLGAHADNRLVASNLISDYSFRCGQVVASEVYAKRAKVYLYRFNHRSSWTKLDPIPGVYHGLDLPYVFGTAKSFEAKFTKEEARLSDRMQMVWTSFAKNLAPTGASVDFPAFTNSTREGLVLDVVSDSVESNFRGDYCDFWGRLFVETNKTTNVFTTPTRMQSLPKHALRLNETTSMYI